MPFIVIIIFLFIISFGIIIIFIIIISFLSLVLLSAQFPPLPPDSFNLISRNENIL